jgi:adenylosuccinate lyase
MATEVILMQCVKAGGDRQILHEAIREHSMAAGRRVSHIRSFPLCHTSRIVSTTCDTIIF